MKELKLIKDGFLCIYNISYDENKYQNFKQYIDKNYSIAEKNKQIDNVILVDGIPQYDTKWGYDLVNNVIYSNFKSITNKGYFRKEISSITATVSGKKYADLYHILDSNQFNLKLLYNWLFYQDLAKEKQANYKFNNKHSIVNLRGDEHIAFDDKVKLLEQYISLLKFELIEKKSVTEYESFINSHLFNKQILSLLKENLIIFKKNTEILSKFPFKDLIDSKLPTEIVPNKKYIKK